MIRTYRFGEITLEDILKREEEVADVSALVSSIIADVRENGDEAVRRYSAQFDSMTSEALALSQEEMEEGLKEVDADFFAVLQEAAENIRLYHEKQKRTDFVVTQKQGVVLGQRVTPLERVGIYVPGGTASYPSTVLMNAIPAKIAGVDEIVMVTPAKDGKISPNILAAAKIAGVERIFKVGGAQAVAALAYGTQEIPCVDKIVGPGNAFVAEAKRQVFGKVAIDMIAGPSEILVIADEASDAEIVAADLLSQAEHDKLASAILITNSEVLAKQVAEALEEQIPLLPRAEIARDSIDNYGKIIITETLAQAIDISNAVAPEHLEICVDDPFRYLADIRHAGSVFLGRFAPEALGDYFAGTNHTLPTSGTARFSSPLSVDDFVKKSSFTYYTEEALLQVADKIELFANKEGLQAHGRSVMIRKEKRSKP